MEKLLKYEEKLNREQIKRIAEAANENDQIGSSFAAAPHLRKFLKRHAELIPVEQLKKFI